MSDRSIALNRSHPRGNRGTSPGGFLELISRHLDLSSLRGRGSGKVRCIFHPDRTPSLSIDKARGLFYCFGCGVGGGARRFAELVGGLSPGSHGPRTSNSDLEEPWQRAVRQVQANGARAAEWGPYDALSDFIRRSARAASHGRVLATNLLGPEDPRTWPLLERAARVERDGLATETALVEILGTGRIS